MAYTNSSLVSCTKLSSNHSGQRRESSKSLAWSSVLLAFRNVEEVGAVVERPKALGDIRGVSYIYGMFCRFGVITRPIAADKK